MISYHIGGEMREPEMEVHMEDAFLLFVIAVLSVQISFGQTPDSTKTTTDTIPKPQTAPVPAPPDTTAKAAAAPAEKPAGESRTFREKIDFGFDNGLLVDWLGITGFPYLPNIQGVRYQSGLALPLLYEFFPTPQFVLR